MKVQNDFSAPGWPIKGADSSKNTRRIYLKNPKKVKCACLSMVLDIFWMGGHVVITRSMLFIVGSLH